MVVTVKHSKTGETIDVSGIYMMALEGTINVEEYRTKLDELTGKE